jgi:hypothetical protein
MRLSRSLAMTFEQWQLLQAIVIFLTTNTKFIQVIYRIGTLPCDILTYRKAVFFTHHDVRKLQLKKEYREYCETIMAKSAA